MITRLQLLIPRGTFAASEIILIETSLAVIYASVELAAIVRATHKSFFRTLARAGSRPHGGSFLICHSLCRCLTTSSGGRFLFLAQSRHFGCRLTGRCCLLTSGSSRFLCLSCRCIPSTGCLSGSRFLTGRSLLSAGSGRRL